MSTEQNNFRCCERVGMTRGFMLRRRILAGVAAILMGASLVFSGSVSAHDIDVKKARELVREYARSVRDQSGGKYIHFSTRCTAMFPNHNHYASCIAEYQNAKDTAAGVYTCKEMITVFFSNHNSRDASSYYYFMTHASGNRCGSRRLEGRLCDTNNSCK
jgi:hypothetical protein